MYLIEGKISERKTRFYDTVLRKKTRETGLRRYEIANRDLSNRILQPEEERGRDSRQTHKCVIRALLKERSGFKRRL